ncbi:MAG: glycerophosphodiester phosphodiesterase [Acidobacteria bacterium]|nr:glycerophosphodiester phosphodiesterase [Acidobacteriota bacterium]
MTLSVLSLAARPWIVGHRGAAGEAPENSLESLLLAVEQGADMIELDLQLTADGSLVACHDWTLERMGGIELTIEETPLDALREVEISGEFRTPRARQFVSTLSSILALLPPEMPLNLELKRRLADPAVLAARLAEAVASRDQLLISSFDWLLLAEVRRWLPKLPLAPLGGRSANPRELIATAVLLDAWSVHCSRTLVDHELMELAAARPVLTYTVNELAEAQELFALGVAGVFSDFPGRLRRQIEAA